jgi:glycosyltransferase involved in cell wall biosynthesis
MSSRSRSVLMVTRVAPPFYSGAGSQALALSTELCRAGYRVVVFTAGGESLLHGRYDAAGVEVVCCRTVSGGRVAKLQFVVGLAAHLLVHARRYGIVHLHGSYFVLRLLRLLKPLLDFGIVFKPTRMSQDDPATIARDRPGLLPSVDRWICIATPFHESARAVGVPEERLSLIPNGVDLPRFSPLEPHERESVRRELGFDRFTWVTVGSLAPRKRIELAVEAWSVLGAPRPLLAIVGPNGAHDLGVEANYAKAVRGVIAETELGDDVRLLGQRDDVPQILAAADAFVFTSSQEGLPNAVLEALAAGLPVVSTVFEAADDVLALADGRITFVDADPAAVADAVAASRNGRRVPDPIHRIAMTEVAGQYGLVYAEVHARA